MLLLFDIGATKTRLALSKDCRTYAKPLIFETDHTAGGQAELATMARQLVGNQPIELVVGGIAGTVDRAKGILLNAPNLPDWGKVDLASLFRTAFKAPLILENDTAVVGLGEATHGAGKSHGIVVYITISTGVNGVRLVDGKIDRSTYGFEIGRQIVDQAGDHLVTLEDMIGGHSLQQRYGRLPKSIDDPAVWRTETKHLARALYNLILEWSPSQIVLGGSMMRDIPLDWVRAEMKLLPPVFVSLPELVLGELGAEGGMYGAMELARQHMEED